MVGKKRIFFLTSVCPTSGFVIVGEDNTGKLDLGIFIASIVPDGPADKDGRIKPGLSHREASHKSLYVWWLAGRNVLLFIPHFSPQVDVSSL